MHSSFSLDPVTKEKIYVVQDGTAISVDFKSELCAGCGVCVEACPTDVITLTGRGDSRHMAHT